VDTKCLDYQEITAAKALFKGDDDIFQEIFPATVAVWTPLPKQAATARFEVRKSPEAVGLGA